MRHQPKAGALLTGDEYEATDSHYEGVSTVASSGTTETLDVSAATVQDVTLTDNCTFTFTGSVNGQASSFTLVLRQDGTGSRTVTWPVTVVWAGGAAPTLSTAAAAVDVLTFFTVDGGSVWYGFSTGGAQIEATSFVGASVTHSVAQNLNNGAETVLSFDTEEYDTHAFHSTAADTSRLTVPSGKAGYYVASADVYFTASTNGSIRQVAFKKNGSSDFIASHRMPDMAGATTAGVALVSRPIPMVATDYLEVVAVVDGASLQALVVANYSPRFSMYRVGV